MEDNNIPEVPDPFQERQRIDIQSYSTKTDDVYWRFVDELEANFKSFISDARAGELNKTAAQRARKLSVTLRKSLKEFREISVAHDKMKVRKPRETTSLSDDIRFVVEDQV